MNEIRQEIDKKLVAERFARARATYTNEAHVQRQVAEKMMGLLGTVLQHTSLSLQQPSAVRVLEIGCGTGCYSTLLKQTLNPGLLLLNDLCPEMKSCVEPLLNDSVRFNAADAEEMPLPSHMHLITSCSTVQWFTRPQRFFERCHESLATGGILAFSTFGTRNLAEISTLTGNGLHYYPLEDWKKMLAPYYEILHAEEEVATLGFDTPKDVLRHLKQTGVTGTEKRVWTRTRLQSFTDEYIRLFRQEDAKVTLTYHPIYLIARKK